MTSTIDGEPPPLLTEHTVGERRHHGASLYVPNFSTHCFCDGYATFNVVYDEAESEVSVEELYFARASLPDAKWKSVHEQLGTFRAEMDKRMDDWEANDTKVLGSRSDVAAWQHALMDLAILSRSGEPYTLGIKVMSVPAPDFQKEFEVLDPDEREACSGVISRTWEVPGEHTEEGVSDTDETSSPSSDGDVEPSGNDADPFADGIDAGQDGFSESD